MASVTLKSVPGYGLSLGSVAERAWVPEACTLPNADRPARVAEFDELFGSLRELRREAPTWLRLRLDTALESRTRDLLARESGCCSFFDFDVHRAADELVVDIRVPADRTAVLDELEKRP